MASSTIRMSGLASGLDTESIVAGLMSAQRYKATKIENKKTKAEWKQEIWQDLNKKVYAFYTGSLSKLKMQTNFLTRKASSSNESYATATATSSASTGTHTLVIGNLASAQNVTGKVVDVTSKEKLSDLGFHENDVINLSVSGAAKTITIGADTTVDGLVSKLNSAGLNASFDSTQKRFFISSKASGVANKFTIDSTNSTGLTNLGLGEITGSAVDGSTTGGMNVVAAKDASFTYNGVAMTNSSNTVTINGLTINLVSPTSGNTININVTKDTDSVYNMVKTFVKDYNSLLKELNTYYDADTAKGYEPLTDDQKDAMSDTEVEKWETKIKNSLLRRDDTVSSLIDSMRTNMESGIKVNGKSYALSTYGIGSKSYTENGQLHIAGDTDDSEVSTDKDKLKTALESDPDTVADVLSGLASNLYNTLFKSMKSIPNVRSALTVYNDKEMKKQIEDYQDDLDDLNDKLDAMEDRYYKQFSAMETAMAKMNSKGSALSSMLGSK